MLCRKFLSICIIHDISLGIISAPFCGAVHSHPLVRRCSILGITRETVLCEADIRARKAVYITAIGCCLVALGAGGAGVGLSIRSKKSVDSSYLSRSTIKNLAIKPQCRAARRL